MLEATIMRNNMVDKEKSMSVIDALGDEWFDLIEGMFRYDVDSRLTAT